MHVIKLCLKLHIHKFCTDTGFLGRDYSRFIKLVGVLDGKRFLRFLIQNAVDREVSCMLLMETCQEISVIAL
jgi:hypothetical protein